jgi:hypothetical protein
MNRNKAHGWMDVRMASRRTCASAQQNTAGPKTWKRIKVQGSMDQLNQTALRTQAMAGLLDPVETAGAAASSRKLVCDVHGSSNDEPRVKQTRRTLRTTARGMRGSEDPHRRRWIKAAKNPKNPKSVTACGVCASQRKQLRADRSSSHRIRL